MINDRTEINNRTNQQKSFKISLNISDFFYKVATAHDTVMCSTAINGKLPFPTEKVGRYGECRIKIITPKELRG
jgi:hypothetical protein